MNNPFKKSIKDLIEKKNWSCNPFGLKMKIGRTNDWNERNDEIKVRIVIWSRAN